MEKLLTYGGVAQILGCSERKVWDLVNVTGEIKKTQIGKRQVRITEEALQEYINNSEFHVSIGA